MSCRPDYKVAVAAKSRLGRGTEASPSSVPVDADVSLLAQVRSGDREGLEKLYRRHGPSLLALLTRILDDRQMAEEVIQDTFLAVWNGAPFDGRSRVRTWLVAIAIRRAGSQRRKRRFPVGNQTRDSASDDPTPEDIVVGGLDVERFVKELSELTRLQREVVLLAFAEQLTHPEIAKVLGVRLGTVKSRLHGAKRALVRKWEQGDTE
jgi:RNA polymerase sigma factor (sigma-70 family)